MHMKLLTKILMIVSLVEAAGYMAYYFIIYANPGLLGYTGQEAFFTFGDFTLTLSTAVLAYAIVQAVCLVGGAIVFPFAWRNISKPKMGDHSILLGVLSCIFLSLYAGILYILSYSFERRYEQMADEAEHDQHSGEGPSGHGFYGYGTMADSVREAKVEEPEATVMSEERKAALLAERETLSRKEEELRSKLNSFGEIEESRISAARIASLKEEIAKAEGEEKAKLEWTLSDEREHLRHLKADLERKRAPLMKERDEALARIGEIDRELNS